MKKNPPRILGRRLAREISHAEIEQSRAGTVLAEQPQLPRLPGVETQTLIYPPDHDTLSGGVGV